MDKLEFLFEKQKELNKRIGVDTDSFITESEKSKWLLNYSLALQQEIAEMIDSVPWKWWAKYQKYDEQNAKVEIVDMLHFWISLAQVAGLSADDVFNLYIKKNKVNFQRQEDGYVVKRDDNKSLKI